MPGWAALARAGRLDEGRVVDTARNMASAIARNAGIAIRGQNPVMADRMRETFESIPSVMRNSGRATPPPARVKDLPTGGRAANWNYAGLGRPEMVDGAILSDKSEYDPEEDVYNDC